METVVKVGFCGKTVFKHIRKMESVLKSTSKF